MPYQGIDTRLAQPPHPAARAVRYPDVVVVDVGFVVVGTGAVDVKSVVVTDVVVDVVGGAIRPPQPVAALPVPLSADDPSALRATTAAPAATASRRRFQLVPFGLISLFIWFSSIDFKSGNCAGHAND